MTGYLVDTEVETSVTGQDGFDLTGDSDSLLVLSTGSVIALAGGDGINASNNSQIITLDGLAYSASATGVVMSGFGGDLFLNGQAQGGDNGVTATGSDETIKIDGQAEGGNDGVVMTGSSSFLVINGEVEGVGDGVSFVDTSTDTVNIGTRGDLNGFFGLDLYGDSGSSITNDGHISGSVCGVDAEFSTNGAITNNGVISSSGTGAEEAAITLNGADENISNTGKISGPIAFEIFNGANANIYNSGTIAGNLEVSDTSIATIDNSGVWHAQNLDLLSSGENSIQNTGNISAGIGLGLNGTGYDVLTNYGTITGGIELLGNQNEFYNDGAIHGFVSSLAGFSQISNDGVIYGNVDMYQGSILNTLHGRIDGAVTAANSDTFNFTGSFGNVVIKDFVSYASSHTGFDVINFTDDNFASYADVQKQMLQVGHNVVITLDANDVIVLDNTLLYHLSLHNFTFG